MLAGLTKNWWSLVARGVLAIGFGLFAWTRPEFFWASVLLIFGVYAVVDGVLALISAARGDTGTRWPNVMEGMAGIVVGFLALVFPDRAGRAIVVLIGAWAIVTGVFEIVGAIQLRKVIDNEWTLILSGVISVLFGIALVAMPGAGALALVWVIGTFAIIAGVLSCILAFKLKSHAH